MLNDFTEYLTIFLILLLFGRDYLIPAVFAKLGIKVNGNGNKNGNGNHTEGMDQIRKDISVMQENHLHAISEKLDVLIQGQKDIIKNTEQEIYILTDVKKKLYP